MNFILSFSGCFLCEGRVNYIASYVHMNTQYRLHTDIQTYRQISVIHT